MFCRSRRARTFDLRFWRPTFFQLNYTPVSLYSRQDLHLQPTVYKTDALTIAPREYIVAGVGLEPTSAAYETALETTSRHPAFWYSWYDSNIQPSAYQADALTTCATRVFLSVLQAGFEPATSSFVARCSNPLSYWSVLSFKSESNQQPAHYK